MPVIYKKGNPEKEGKKSYFSFLFLAVIAPIFFVYSLNYLSKTPTVQNVILNPVRQILGDFFSPVHKIANKELYSKGGEFAVVVKNLKTGEAYSHNSDLQFESASLYKLWVMNVTYQKIKDGKLSEEDTIDAKIDDLDKTLGNTVTTPTPADGATGDQTSTEPPKTVSFKVGDALNKMITVSDNYAALTLTNKLGTKIISKFLTDTGYSDSNFNSPPLTSARDIASFLEQLHEGKLIDNLYSDKMLSLLKNQELNDRIPKYLPTDVVVAHKTGELEGNKHDAGIVFSKSGDYIIVVLSKSTNPKTASENIANFSREIYKFEQTR